MHRTGVALGIVLTMLTAIVAFIAPQWRPARFWLN